MTFQRCPHCTGYKALRLVGRYEPDTNAGEEIEVDTTLSCPCVLTADEWQVVTANLAPDDFVQEPYL